MKTLIVGLDAFDPGIFERLLEQGRLPNLAHFVEAGNYARFSVSNPPQSEVSWTSIATGLNPGGHGLFDFVHRNPENYAFHVSMLPTERGIGGTQFVPPYKARTIFDQAVRRGFPATVLWWPVTFPARPESPVRTIPGLGTPDIHGQLGVGTLFSMERKPENDPRKTRIETFNQPGKDRYSGFLKGPVRQTRSGVQETGIELQLDITGEKTARLQLDRQVIDLVLGEWSPILEVTFKVGLFFKLHAITRVILTQVQPSVRLYFLPLQLHPLHSPWRYASPQSFVKGVWQESGPFLTIGWPQDTTGLEDGCISDSQFLNLCEMICSTRERILMREIERFDEGILASVFDSLDRIQHMFLRDRPDVVETWYEKLDAMVGRVAQSLAGQRKNGTHLVVVSDHGFSRFDYKVHLNHWLVSHGYLSTKEPGEAGSLKNVDWPQSQAYALGLNSIYLNLKGREGQGKVAPDQIEPLVNQMCDELQAWRGPDGRSVVQRVWQRQEALDGPLAAYGPDLLVGYAPGYRGSAQTGLGTWENTSLEPNQDHWGADHCIDPQAVPGVIFSNKSLQNYPSPSYRDIPPLTIGEKPDSTASAPPPSGSGEDQDIMEERLKSLGYL